MYSNNTEIVTSNYILYKSIKLPSSIRIWPPKYTLSQNRQVIQYNYKGSSKVIFQMNKTKCFVHFFGWAILHNNFFWRCSQPITGPSVLYIMAKNITRLIGPKCDAWGLIILPKPRLTLLRLPSSQQTIPLRPTDSLDGCWGLGPYLGIETTCTYIHIISLYIAVLCCIYRRKTV